MFRETFHLRVGRVRNNRKFLGFLQKVTDKVTKGCFTESRNSEVIVWRARRDYRTVQRSIQ